MALRHSAARAWSSTRVQATWLGKIGVFYLVLVFFDSIWFDILIAKGPYPYVDPAVIPLLDELAKSTYDYWDSDQKLEDQERLWSIAGIALSSCATIRSVLETETLDERRYPKESFLVVLIRNVLLGANAELMSR